MSRDEGVHHQRVVQCLAAERSAAASRDADRADLERYEDFVYSKAYDLLVRGEAIAKANGRDVIQPFDIPITNGLQERTRESRRMDEEIELPPILDYVAGRPTLDLSSGIGAEAMFLEIVGGLSMALPSRCACRRG